MEALTLRLKRFAKSLLRPLRHRWVTQSKLESDLRRLGVQEGNTLLVHSSVSSLGFVVGGLESVIGALASAVGSQGTLVMPTHTFRIMNAGCREFDVRNTPSYVGRLTDEFRKRKDVIRSHHPTHSVAACGPRAKELVADHEFSSTPCGAGTPYDHILQSGGQILLLGVELRRNTCFHTVEAIAEVPYLMRNQTERFRITDEDGSSRDLDIYMHAAAKPSRFNELLELMRDDWGVVREGRVGQANCLLIDGREFRERMLAKLREEPFFLLCDRERLETGAPVEHSRASK